MGIQVVLGLSLFLSLSLSLSIIGTHILQYKQPNAATLTVLTIKQCCVGIENTLTA